MPPSRSRPLRHRSTGSALKEEAEDEAKQRVAGKSTGIGGRQDGRGRAPRADQLARTGAGRRRDGLEPDHAAGGGGGGPQPAAAAEGGGDGSRGGARRRELRRAALRGVRGAGVTVRGSLDRGGGGPSGLRRADPVAARAGGP